VEPESHPLILGTVTEHPSIPARPWISTARGPTGSGTTLPPDQDALDARIQAYYDGQFGEELEAELAEAGLVDVHVVGVEGPAGLGMETPGRPAATRLPDAGS
jgi:hypothetical protein